MGFKILRTSLTQGERKAKKKTAVGCLHFYSISRTIRRIVSILAVSSICQVPFSQIGQTQKEAEARSADGEIPSPTESQQDIPGVAATMVDLAFDRAGKAKRERNTVVDNCVDQACGDTLMFLCYGVGEDERRGWKTHIHPPGNDDRADKCLRPVALADRRGGDEDRADGEGCECDRHHPGRPQTAKQEPRGDRGDSTGDGGRAEEGGAQERRGSPELLVKLPDIIHPYPKATPAADHAGQNKCDVGR